MISLSLLVVTVLANAAIEARPVGDVLVSLVERHRAGEPGPSVTLALEGGAKVSGVVTDLSSSGLAVLDGEVVHFVDPRAVIAISVPASAAGASPTRTLTKVDVQRRAEDHARALTELFGGAPVKIDVAWKTATAPGLADNGDALAVVSAALDEAAAGVRAAAESDADRRDLARRLKRIRIAESSRAGASFSGDTLAVGVAPASGLTGRASAWEVRRALASL